MDCTSPPDECATRAGYGSQATRAPMATCPSQLVLARFVHCRIKARTPTAPRDDWYPPETRYSPAAHSEHALEPAHTMVSAAAPLGELRVGFTCTWARGEQSRAARAAHRRPCTRAQHHLRPSSTSLTKPAHLKCWRTAPHCKTCMRSHLKHRVS